VEVHDLEVGVRQVPHIPLEAAGAGAWKGAPEGPRRRSCAWTLGTGAYPVLVGPVALQAVYVDHLQD